MTFELPTNRNPAENVQKKNDRVLNSRLIRVGHWVEVAFGVSEPYVGVCVATDSRSVVDAITVDSNGTKTRVCRDQCRPVGKIKLSRMKGSE